VGLLLAVTACGRLGFDRSDDDAPDGSTLPCGAAPKFAVGAAVPRDMVAVATPTGFAVFTVDQPLNLRGWSFDWTAGLLASVAQDVAIDIDITGAFGAATIGDDIVVAAVHGTSAALTLGSTYHALDATLAERSNATVAGRVVGVEPIAMSGRTKALAGLRYEGGDIAVHGLAANGTDLATRTMNVGAEKPSELGIVPAGTGYAITWVDVMASPNVTKLALLDDSLAVVYGPVTVSSGTGFDTIRPVVRWALASNTYAVAWYEKNDAGDDDLYAQVFDATLQPRFAAKLVQGSAVFPKLATDGTAFWIGYGNYGASPDRVDVARLTPDGAMTIRSAVMGGGTPLAFAMVERAGQAVLVYAEDNGGVDVWFDPLCP